MKNNYQSMIRSLLTEFNDDSNYKMKLLKENQEFYQKRLHATNIYITAKYEDNKLQHENKWLEIEFEVICISCKFNKLYHL